MIITKFDMYINEKSKIEMDYANNKISNIVNNTDDYQYENQGWFFYKKSILRPDAKKPPKDGIYDIKADYGGSNVRTDIAKFENNKFKESKEYSLKDEQITHWKIKQSEDINKYKYDKETGKFKK
jgi:hypothetical protein